MSLNWALGAAWLGLAIVGGFWVLGKRTGWRRKAIAVGVLIWTALILADALFLH